MMTSHVRTAIAMPAAHVGTLNWLLRTTAMEFGCVNGVVKSAARPATPAKTAASFGARRPSRR